MHMRREGVRKLLFKVRSCFVHMNLNKREVLIFKAPSDELDDGDGPYKKKFEENGFCTISVGVLQFQYINFNILLQHLRNPKEFSGVVFTSPRAVQAVATCVKDAGPVLQEWQDHVAFVIGEGTARVLKEQLGIVGEGSDTGNAHNLADFILQRKCRGPLLFPCGSIKREVLPTKLSQGGVDIVAVTVYQTLAHPRLEQQLCDIVSRNTFPEIAVFFSPSGVRFSMPLMNKLNVPLQHIKFVAIGPTTEEALKDAQLPVWAVARKPTPQDLMEAVLAKHLR